MISNRKSFAANLGKALIPALLGLAMACGSGSDGSTPVLQDPTVPTVEQVNQTAVLTKNFMMTGSFMSMPGVPMVVGSRGQYPLLAPLAVTSTDCPTVTYSADYKTITMDFSGCPNMYGSIVMSFWVDANGDHHSVYIYNNYGYNYSYASGSLNGQLTMDGTVVGGTTFNYHMQSFGLSGTASANGSTLAWTETMDFNLSMVISGSTVSMMEWGSLGYAGSFGSYSADISNSDPLTWSNLSSCPYPTSGTINWTTGGLHYTSTFGKPGCGDFTVNGKAYSFLH